MNCPHCSAELPEGSRFCGNCGKSTDEPTGQPRAASPPPAAPPPPAQQGGYYSAPPSGPVDEEKMNPLAIVSLVAGILSVPLCCCLGGGALPGIVAVVTGFMAISQCNQDPNMKGRGLAIAGLVCGGVGVLLGILYWVMQIAGMSMQQYGAPGSF